MALWLILRRRSDRVLRSTEALEATVHGTRRHRVKLWIDEDGELAGSCDSPIGVSGAFCKRCVAVGLAALEAGGNLPRSISLDEVRDHLAGLGKEELVALLIAEAREDERLLDRLRWGWSAAATKDARPRRWS